MQKAQEKRLKSMMSANVLSRVYQKCREPDEIFVKRGYEEFSRKTLAGHLNVTNTICQMPESPGRLKRTF
jgi:hypothetical protein